MLVLHKIHQLLRRFIPQPILQKTHLFVRFAPSDLVDWATGNTDPLIPPRRKIFIGGPEFRQIGDEFFRYFQKYGEITPQGRILDIGCGIGRMARPFVPFLDRTKGSFDGFDIDNGGIKWCQAHYFQYPHFRFQRANIYNKFYNPSGTVQADAYTFPYADASFDFAFATSVFTHLPPKSIARYLRETSRVLAAGGRALLTAFLWNPESQALVTQGKSTIPFREYGDLIVRDPMIPEDAIAIRQPEWEIAVREAGLETVGDILWGSWCGRSQATSYQDIVIVRKPG